MHLRAQQIIYDAVKEVRKWNPNFPYKLSNCYHITTALSKAWLVQKKPPNRYRSKSTGRIKYTAQEVIDIIEQNQKLFYKHVVEDGLSAWYSSFAKVLNNRFSENWSQYELPVDWKWISKKLWDSQGTNLHTWWAFQALRLSSTIKTKLSRILQWLPIYPNVRKIRSCVAFAQWLGDHLKNWQWKRKRWWFHVAVLEYIKIWNADENLGGKYFQLPVALFPNERQESLWNILWLTEYSASSFLDALWLDSNIWNFRFDTYRDTNTEKKEFIHFVHSKTWIMIWINDFTISQDVIKWIPESIKKYGGKINVIQVQDLYDAFSSTNGEHGEFLRVKYSSFQMRKFE
jgi:hypothetical protein